MQPTKRIRYVACWAVLCVLVIPPLAAQTASPVPAVKPGTDPADGQHDFDFEFGSWKTHLKRLLHPLSNSTSWVEYQGTSVVHKLWEGRANVGELEVGGPGHIEGMSLRLYNPQSRQ